MSTADGSIVIRGGTVIDGTGAPGVVADVLVRDGHVVEIGPGLDGDTVLDASGCVVAPGFIDIHTHYDAQVFWDPALTPSVYHGVTTVVAGNCGFSIAPTRPAHRELIAQTLEKVEDMDVASLIEGIPWEFESFPEYLAAVERRGTVLNFAAFIGHTPLRIYAMGDEAVGREATAEEIATMTAMVGEAMDAGAAGFASSFAITHRGADGQPIPSRWAGPDEIEALCKAVGDTGRGVVAVNGGQQLSMADCYDLQPRIGAPITYTALLTTSTGSHLQALDVHKAGRARGADVWPQVSCRPLSFSMTMVEPFTLNTNPVFAELMPLSIEERRDAYADPAWRNRVRDAWANKQGLQPRWDTYEVMQSTAHPHHIGERITDLAEAAGADPLDHVLDLALDEPDLKLRVKAMLANDDVEGVEILLQADGCTLGLSDAGAHVGQLCDAVLATDLLGNWVRERQVLTLEQAIHKLTQVQADLFGFTDRGVLRVGAHADVVVFDPETVGPGPVKRVQDFPAGAERLTADEPTGMRHLLVNGVPVQIDGHLVDDALASRPGVLVRPDARR
jgi:N-acyl-D-aspartate/D-glutamate deacylase